jgi:hypothetical protein
MVSAEVPFEEAAGQLDEIATYQALKKYFHWFAINSFNFGCPMNTVHLGHRSHGGCKTLHAAMYTRIVVRFT